MNGLLVNTSTLPYTKNEWDTNCGYDRKPSIRVLGEKLIVYQFIKNFTFWYGHHWFITMFRDLDTGPYFILNQINSAYISPQFLFIIRFNIVFPFIPRMYMWLFHSYYQAQIPASNFCFVFYICYKPYPNDYSNNYINVGIWNSSTVTVISNTAGYTPVPLSKVRFI